MLYALATSTANSLSMTLPKASPSAVYPNPDVIGWLWDAQALWMVVQSIRAAVDRVVVRDIIRKALDVGPGTIDTPADSRFVDTTPSARRLRVLIAEDNPVNQKLIAMILEKRGHEIHIAYNGRDAVDLWQRGQFDLILMDLQMPVMGGVEATRFIRARE